MKKIIDCITFFDNNFMFDFRYNVMNKFVDKFIICESLYDHRNNKKKVNFDPKKKYANNNKILHIIIKEAFPENTNLWQNQAIQREHIIKTCSNKLFIISKIVKIICPIRNFVEII